MRGWDDCPRCRGTGDGEGGRGCGYRPILSREIRVDGSVLDHIDVRSAYPELPVTPPALPRCPYGSDDRHERGDILREEYLDTPWQLADAPWNRRGVRAVLVCGRIGDYAVYLGAGSAEWVREHGAKLGFRQAQGFFPGITAARYRE